jgi:hypothetical protein
VKAKGDRHRAILWYDSHIQDFATADLIELLRVVKLLPASLLFPALFARQPRRNRSAVCGKGSQFGIGRPKRQPYTGRDRPASSIRANQIHCSPSDCSALRFATINWPLPITSITWPFWPTYACSDIVDTRVVADSSLLSTFPGANRVAITPLPAGPPFENVKTKFCVAVRGQWTGSGHRGSGHNRLMSERRYTSHHLRLHSVQSISCVATPASSTSGAASA